MPTSRLSYLVPHDREEDLVAELWERGTVGVQVLAGGEAGTVRLEAYFEGVPEAPEVPGAHLLGVEPVAAEDWMAPYRRAARPFPVGRRWWLDPRDPDDAGDDGAGSPPGRRLLRIPARAAFGTGSHASTRLVLELLEEVDLRGLRVLDVGTGTGILALAALLSGARSAAAFDADPAAPCHARENARRHGVPLPLFAGTAAALSPIRAAGRFDLALVNVIPEEIAADLPRLARLLAPGGEAVFSGILAGSGPAAQARLRAAGFSPVSERVEGEWVAYRVRR